MLRAFVGWPLVLLSVIGLPVRAFASLGGSATSVDADRVRVQLANRGDVRAPERISCITLPIPLARGTLR